MHVIVSWYYEKWNQCSCVNYIRDLLFLIFRVSKDSAVTQLRCGAKYAVCFVSHFMDNTTVKYFENGSKFAELMTECSHNDRMKAMFLFIVESHKFVRAFTECFRIFTDLLIRQLN